MLEAMVYQLRVSCPWHDFPVRFGPWESVYTRWRRWNANFLWAIILDLLNPGATGQLRHLDASNIKVHQDASNPVDGQVVEKIGRTKGGLNTKLTAMVDSKGRAVQLNLSLGNRTLPAGRYQL